MSDSGESTIDRQPFVKVEHFFDTLRFHAAGTAHQLDASRRSPGRHNKTIERLALWYSLNLEMGCERAQSPDNAAQLYDRSLAKVDAETRYDVESAVQLIPSLFPYSGPDDRSRLRALPDKHFTEWGNEMARREPALVAQWHGWLWREGSAEGDHGEASVLAVAAGRLAVGLERILDYA